MPTARCDCDSTWAVHGRPHARAVCASAALPQRLGCHLQGSRRPPLPCPRTHLQRIGDAVWAQRAKQQKAPEVAGAAPVAGHCGALRGRGLAPSRPLVARLFQVLQATGRAAGWRHAAGSGNLPTVHHLPPSMQAAGCPPSAHSWQRQGRLSRFSRTLASAPKPGRLLFTRPSTPAHWLSLIQRDSSSVMGGGAVLRAGVTARAARLL